MQVLGRQYNDIRLSGSELPGNSELTALFSLGKITAEERLVLSKAANILERLRKTNQNKDNKAQGKARGKEAPNSFQANPQYSPSAGAWQAQLSLDQVSDIAGQQLQSAFGARASSW
jgi:hypothetical protein